MPANQPFHRLGDRIARWVESGNRNNGNGWWMAWIKILGSCITSGPATTSSNVRHGRTAGCLGSPQEPELFLGKYPSISVRAIFLEYGALISTYASSPFAPRLPTGKESNRSAQLEFARHLTLYSSCLFHSFLLSLLSPSSVHFPSDFRRLYFLSSSTYP